MARKLENGWEEWPIRICRQCRPRLSQPGSASFALFLLASGSCGHAYPGYP
jgi:hypothetical protein